jgi:hypothetical protein
MNPSRRLQLGHPAISRRTAIQAGSVGLLGLGINHLAALRAEATQRPTARSVIYIFLSGGLAQHESFDMKPDAPDGIRGEFKPIATQTPGVQICEHLPMLAARSRHWALVRSLTHPSNEHSEAHMVMLSGRTQRPRGFNASAPQPSDWPSIAAIAGRVTEPRNNLPPAVALPERLIHRTGRVIPGQFAGMMGSHYDPWFIEASPFNPSTYGAYPEYGFHHALGAENPDQLKFQAPNLTLPEGLGRGRLGRRLELLRHVEQQRQQLEQAAETQDFDRQRQQAVSLLSDDRIRKAFDVADADPKETERYGANAFGWSIMMARRLVEAGVNLVQVNLGNNECWDTHQAAFPNLRNYLLPPTDRAVSALLDDLHASGRLDETLIVMAGEFGRTPKISTLPGVKLPGRDHWGAVQTAFFAGGGVRGGTVIGSSDRTGGFPAADPQTPEGMAATIYEALGIPREASWSDAVDRPHHVYNGEPIRGLMG